MLFNFASPAQEKWYYGGEKTVFPQFFSMKLTSDIYIRLFNLPILFYCVGEIRSLKLREVTAQVIQALELKQILL